MPSNCYLCVGQCGNQIGRQLSLAPTDSILHVDSEPKVVDGAPAQAKASPQNQLKQITTLTEQSGRGSNWALGYTSGLRPARKQRVSVSMAMNDYAQPAPEVSEYTASRRAQFSQREQGYLKFKFAGLESEGATGAPAFSSGAIRYVDEDTGDDVTLTAAATRRARSESPEREDQHGDEEAPIRPRKSVREIYGGVHARMANASSSSTTPGPARPASAPRVATSTSRKSGPALSSSASNDLVPIFDASAEPFLLHKVRRALEQREGSISKLILLHSVGGGTGSGLSSRLLEDLALQSNLCDSFGSKFPVVTASVLPAVSVSETCLQSYNAVFCLAWLGEYSSAAFLFENEGWLMAEPATSTLSMSAPPPLPAPPRAAAAAPMVVSTKTPAVVAVRAKSKAGASGGPKAAAPAQMKAKAKTKTPTPAKPAAPPDERCSRANSTINEDPPTTVTDSPPEVQTTQSPRPAPNPAVTQKPKPLDSYAAINRDIARSLQAADLDSVLTHLTSLPQRRFVQTYGYGLLDEAPGLFSTNIIDDLTHKKRVARVLPRRKDGKKHLVVAARAIHYRAGAPLLRAEWLPQCTPVAWNERNWLEATTSSVSSLPREQLQQQQPFPDVSLTLSWSRIGDLAAGFLQSAEKKFRHRLFTHWYATYGVEQGEFGEAFESVRGICEEYGRKLV